MFVFCRRYVLVCFFNFFQINILFASGFSAVVSPPRFKISATPGMTTRQVFEIGNQSNSKESYLLKTVDWSFSADGGIEFKDKLQPGSCRPWVAIEQREINIPANATYRFRFEITPPKDSKPQECRFAIMLSENDTSLVKLDNGFNFPISGQIAEIIYVSIGDVKPQLKIIKSYARYINKAPKLFLTVTNTGQAHGRLDGFLQGTDANGTNFDISPSTLPILPGEKREVSLDINEDKRVKPSNIRFPVIVKGKLELGEKTIAFNQKFSN